MSAPREAGLTDAQAARVTAYFPILHAGLEALVNITQVRRPVVDCACS